MDLVVAEFAPKLGCRRPQFGRAAVSASPVTAKVFEKIAGTGRGSKVVAR